LTPGFLTHPKNKRVPTTTPNSPPKFEIRAAGSADLMALAQIIAASFHSLDGVWGWAFPILRLSIYEDLRNRLHSPLPHHICLVAVDCTHEGGNLAGTVEIGLRLTDNWTSKGKNYPYLSNLAVHPSYRRQGAAKELLLSCERTAVAWGFQDLYLHVLEDNTSARKLYRQMGYEVRKIESNWTTLILGRSRQMFLHKRLIPESSN
jgi:ribosomal protein S18 acetylase RimI-like enzyme